ncbi:MAG: EFR1 family ferrodoxin [Bacillota bacterium]|nr:EFR1 family ferrodoxin [Bacillota bacterium]
MQIKTIKAVYFSPVANTKKVVEAVAKVMAARLAVPMEVLDFTLPAARTHSYSFGSDELVVFGVPTYAGRVPNKVLPFVKELFHGEETPAVPIVTFGNRNYDDSLAELRNELEHNGFRTFAAAAFSCRHVFSNKINLLRPDQADMKVLSEFAEKAAQKLKDARKTEDLGSPVQVKGNDPVGPYYRPLGTDGQPAVFLKAKPLTNPERCDECGLCAEVCPLGSIDPKDVYSVPGVCIKCMACVRKCPQRAKYFEDEAFLSHIAMLDQNYTKRKEPEVFI